MLKHRLSHKHEFVYKERTKYPWKISFKNYNNNNSLQVFAFQVGRGLLNKLRLEKSTMRTNVAKWGIMGEESFQWWNFHR